MALVTAEALVAAVQLSGTGIAADVDLEGHCVALREVTELARRTADAFLNTRDGGGGAENSSGSKNKKEVPEAENGAAVPLPVVFARTCDVNIRVRTHMLCFHRRT